MKQRLLYPDIARGIAILIVMEWHTMNIHIPWTDEWVLPVFFVIMGLFFKPTASRIELIKKKACTLLVPLAIWSVPMFVIKSCETSLKDTLFLLVNPFDSVFGVTWFLWSTFWCYLIYNEVLLRFGSNKYTKLTAVVIISLVGYYMSFVVISSHRLQLPLYISTSMTCIMFLYIGETFKEFISNDSDKRQLVCKLLTFSIVSGGGVRAS